MFIFFQRLKLLNFNETKTNKNAKAKSSRPVDRHKKKKKKAENYWSTIVFEICVWMDIQMIDGDNLNENRV